MASKKNLRFCEVKIDSTIYALFIAVSDLDQVNNIIEAWATENELIVSLPNDLITNIDISEVSSISNQVAKVNSYVYLQDSLASYLSLNRSSGVDENPVYPTSLNGDSKYELPSITVSLYDEENYQGNFAEYEVEALDVALNVGVNFIGIDYNAGIPIWKVETTDTFNDSSSKLVLKVFNFESDLYILPKLSTSYGLPEKLFSEKDFEISDFAYTLGVTTKFVNLSALTAKFGLNEVVCPIFDSQTDNMYLFYKDASSVWQKSVITEYNDTQFQGTGLEALAGGEFVNNEIYRVVDGTQKTVFIVLSGKFTSQQDAIDADFVSDLPDEIKEMGVFVGRFVVEQNSSTLKIMKRKKYVI